MAFSTVNVPPNISVIPVDTRVRPKVLYLPTVSTNSGRFLLFKDYYGTFTNSTCTVSTTGTDLIDDVNFTIALRSSFMSVSFVADGLRSWRLMNFYDGALTPSFQPTQIPGLQAWYDGNDTSTMTFSGSTVTQWRDKSGNTRTLNQNAGATFSVNSLVFSGGQSYNAINTSNLLRNTYFAIFYVERLNTTGASFILGDTVGGVSGGSLHTGYRSSTNFTFAFWASDLEITGISGTGATRIWSLVLPNPGNRYVNLNGSLNNTFSNNTQLNAFNTLQVGNCVGATAYNGSLYEVLIYTGALTTSQVQQAEGYLAWKWGLQGNLPASHPYKNAPPS